MIWQKAFIMERDRYDGSDVAHLIQCRSASLDWPRLLGRFGPHWRILLGHLIHFGFVFPGEQHAVPRWVLDELLGRLQTEVNEPPPDQRVCQGTLLSLMGYLADVNGRGYHDGRLAPFGGLQAEDVRKWTGNFE
jgi:hypothetical protein